MLKLTGNSFTGSPLCTLQQGNTVHVAWSPWGTTARHEPAIPGFNGQRTDPITAVTHLGNGYRAYSPALMRFTCPDNLSPFGQGGVNPYVYCESDPVNRSDPSGHFFLISFLASLFSSLAAAAADAAATAAAAVGAEAGIAAGAAAGAEAGVATMTVTEFAAATSVASTSAAFGGTGTALSAGATVAAGATAMATTTTAFATSTAAATLGVVNAAIGTAIQASGMTAGGMAIGLGVEYGGIAASFYTKLGRKLAEDPAAPESFILPEVMAAQNTYPLVLEPRVISPGGNAGTASIVLNTNRTLSFAQKAGGVQSTGIQGTPARQQYQQAMGYHPSRLQTHTVVQNLNQTASSATKDEKPASGIPVTGGNLLGINNRQLHQQSYKSADFREPGKTEK